MLPEFQRDIWISGIFCCPPEWEGGSGYGVMSCLIRELRLPATREAIRVEFIIYRKSTL